MENTYNSRFYFLPNLISQADRPEPSVDQNEQSIKDREKHTVVFCPTDLTLSPKGERERIQG